MKFFSKVWDTIHTRTATYVFFVLSALAYVFLNGATWSYSWIAQLYPGGSQFLLPWPPCTLPICSICLLQTERKKAS